MLFRSDLLDHAISNSRSVAERSLFTNLVGQLVPDEALILAALADGRGQALMNVRRRTGGEYVLEGASLVGRTANVALPMMTPVYVTHLLNLGLVEVDKEDPALKDDYEILSAEAEVVRAVKRVGSAMRSRIERRTLLISPVGAALWAASTGDQT